ncbi:MAG: cupredoxin domain-containing protein [Methanotrichaceae archaeon]
MFHMKAIVSLTMLVLLVSALAAAQSTNQAGSTVTVGLVAKNISFNVNSITVPAGSNVVINFNNQDNGIPHNFAVYTNSSATSAIFRGPIITGPNTTTYTFTAPTTPGTYFFRCDVHPTTMTGQFIVTGPTNVTNVTTTNTTNVTQPSTPYAPGFEGIFAITGLLAAAYLVFRRKQ